MTTMNTIREQKERCGMIYDVKNIASMIKKIKYLEAFDFREKII